MVRIDGEDIHDCLDQRKRRRMEPGTGRLYSNPFERVDKDLKDADDTF